METALDILGKSFLCGIGLGAGLLVVYAAWHAGEGLWKRWYQRRAD